MKSAVIPGSTKKRNRQGQMTKAEQETHYCIADFTV
jgi:hypothetical protein